MEMAPFDRSHTSYSSFIVSNYGDIFYHFRNKARYWLKNANFSYPLPFNLHEHVEPLGIFLSEVNRTIKWLIFLMALIAEGRALNPAVCHSQARREPAQATGQSTFRAPPHPLPSLPPASPPPSKAGVRGFLPGKFF